MKIKTSKQFREARHKLGLTLAQCAKLCGVDDRTIRRWEAPKDTSNARDPHPSACKLMEIELAKQPAVDNQGIPY